MNAIKTIKGKIGMRQAAVMFALALTAPILRIIPNYIATESQEGIWLVPLIAIIPALILICALNSLINKYTDKNFDEILEVILGSIAGKIVASLYLVWIFIIISMYLRFYGERFLSTILVGTPIEFIIVIMLAFLFWVVKSSLEAFARCTEILIHLFALIFLVTFLIVVPDIEWSNLYSITHHDLWYAGKASYSLIGLFSYITVLFFFGKQINHKESFKKYGIKSILFVVFLSLLMIISTVGVFGMDIIQQFPFPFFIVLKNLMLFNSIERVESLFIATWVVSDFVIIAMFLFAFFNLLKRLLKLKNKNNVVAPVMFIIFIFSLYIADNSFELSEFSRYIASVVNIGIFWLIPIIVWCVGKLRKKV